MKKGTFGPAFEESSDRERILTQLEVVRDVLLSAAECADLFSWERHRDASDLAQFARGTLCDDESPRAAWMTLREISELTSFGEASISAQLRHLRKPRFGGYVVAKRRRGRVSRGMWEYRIAGKCEQAQYTMLFAGARM